MGDHTRWAYRGRVVAREMEAEIRAGEAPTADLFSYVAPLEAFVVLIRVFVGHAPDEDRAGDVRDRPV
eukprot:3884018-Heterocapsa_arctica.AAC.1